MPAGLKEEVVVVVVVVAKAGKSPTHEAFLAHKEHIKEKLWFIKRCHAVVPCTEVKQSCLTVQELKRGGACVSWCPTAVKRSQRG